MGRLSGSGGGGGGSVKWKINFSEFSIGIRGAIAPSIMATNVLAVLRGA